MQHLKNEDLYAPVLFALTIVASAAEKKPNVVFFLADDLGQRDLACYDSTFYETPNLDWFARDGKGKGLIGALNYLAAKGVNAFSFLTCNAGGDGDCVWPFIARDAKLHCDCLKLDQWGVVFDHATARGLFLHFKLLENELDDERVGAERKPGRVPGALDGGALVADKIASITGGSSHTLTASDTDDWLAACNAPRRRSVKWEQRVVAAP